MQLNPTSGVIPESRATRLGRWSWALFDGARIPDNVLVNIFVFSAYFSTVVIPDPVIHRLQGVPASRQRAEGKRICVEIIQQVREIPGVSGIHVMAYRQEELVAEIIDEAGLLPRRRQAVEAHGRAPLPGRTEATGLDILP